MRKFTFFIIVFLSPVFVLAQRRGKIAQPKVDTIQAVSPRTNSAKASLSKADTTKTSPRARRTSPVKPATTEVASAKVAAPKASTANPDTTQASPRTRRSSPVKPVTTKVASAKVAAPKASTANPDTTQASPRTRRTSPVKPATTEVASAKVTRPRAIIPKTPVTKASPYKAIIPKVNTIFHKLGDDHIRIKVFQYGEAKEPFFINVHDDEITAVSGAKRILENSGGILVKIENGGQRNIRFKLNKKAYMFDPNRIFSRAGIIQTLNMFGGSDLKSIDELEKFAGRILQTLPSHPSCVIALHNNSDGLFSVTSYFAGREREKDAKAVSARPNEDPDDLFLTTDSALFFKLRREKFNAVWQDNENAFKDGSLSIYCGEKNICYLNCETEHGKLSQYWEMISTASKYLKKPVVLENIVYSYQLSPNHDSTQLSNEYDIYFGEKKIGTTKLVNDHGTNGAAIGQLEVIKSFPLYDNMDLVYFRSRTQGPKIELRVDPTKQRAIQDPAKAVIIIKVVP